MQGQRERLNVLLHNRKSFPLLAQVFLTSGNHCFFAGAAVRTCRVAPRHSTCGDIHFGRFGGLQHRSRNNRILYSSTMLEGRPSSKICESTESDQRSIYRAWKLTMEQERVDTRNLNIQITNLEFYQTIRFHSLLYASRCISRACPYINDITNYIHRIYTTLRLLVLLAFSSAALALYNFQPQQAASDPRTWQINSIRGRAAAAATYNSLQDSFNGVYAREVNSLQDLEERALRHLLAARSATLNSYIGNDELGLYRRMLPVEHIPATAPAATSHSDTWSTSGSPSHSNPGSTDVTPGNSPPGSPAQPPAQLPPQTPAQSGSQPPAQHPQQPAGQSSQPNVNKDLPRPPAPASPSTSEAQLMTGASSGVQRNRLPAAPDEDQHRGTMDSYMQQYPNGHNPNEIPHAPQANPQSAQGPQDPLEGANGLGTSRFGKGANAVLTAFGQPPRYGREGYQARQNQQNQAGPSGSGSQGPPSGPPGSSGQGPPPPPPPAAGAAQVRRRWEAYPVEIYV